MSGGKYIRIPSPKQGKKAKKKKKKKKKKKDNTNLKICPGIICFLYMEIIAYPLHHGGQCKDCFYLLEIIPCSVLTDNDECIRIYYGEEQTLVLLHCYPFSRI